MNNEFVIFDWNEKGYGGLSKRDLRDLSDGLFGNSSIYATPICGYKNDNDVNLLKIELTNAKFRLLNSVMGNNYVEKLSLKSDTHNFIFNRYDFKETTINLRDYDPGKISFDSYSNITLVYIYINYILKT